MAPIPSACASARTPARAAVRATARGASFGTCRPSSSDASGRRARTSRAAFGVSTHDRGFTLIEVMVALIVLVLGVLGAASMTLTALRDNKQSSLRSQAVAMAYEMSDLMRMNPGQEAVFTGSAPTGGVGACYAAGCSPADMAKNDYAQWAAKLTGPGGLPNGTAVICRDLTNTTSMSCDNLQTSPIVVKIRWEEKSNNGVYVASAGPRLVVPMAPTCFPTAANPSCATP